MQESVLELFWGKLAHFLISKDILGRIGKYSCIDLEFPCETMTKNPGGMYIVHN